MEQQLTVVSEEELEKWIAAGEVARVVLEKSLDIVDEGLSLLDLANKLEETIKKMGGQPAFPVNISIGSIAAHYSPSVNDQTTIPPKTLVKVDVGVHVNGYIADAAITVALDPSYQLLVEVAKNALKTALSTFKPGIELAEVGARVENIVKAHGLKPIANLSGHLLERYNLHAGKHVPNVRTEPCGKAITGEAYAVEPFVTDGKGYVVEAGSGTIYRLTNVKKINGAELDQLIKELWKNYRNLPFSERWIYHVYGNTGLLKLEKLVHLRRVYRYPILIEVGRGFVAQFEDTIILLSNKIVNTTRVLELLKS